MLLNGTSGPVIIRPYYHKDRLDHLLVGASSAPSLLLLYDLRLGVLFKEWPDLFNMTSGAPRNAVECVHSASVALAKEENHVTNMPQTPTHT